MWDVYEETCFSKKKNAYKWVKHGFATEPVLKKQSIMWKLIDSPLNKKVPGAAVSKESDDDCLLGHERTYNLLIALIKNDDCEQCIRWPIP